MVNKLLKNVAKDLDFAASLYSGLITGIMQLKVGPATFFGMPEDLGEREEMAAQVVVMTMNAGPDGCGEIKAGDLFEAAEQFHVYMSMKKLIAMDYFAEKGFRVEETIADDTGFPCYRCVPIESEGANA